MDRDRTEICKIISEMLDNPGECEIYHTSTAYTKLEHYIESERSKALGYAHAWACSSLDKGNDPRIQKVPIFLDNAKRDLA